MADRNLPEHIANQLRRDILRGTLAPGATIKERDSAAGLAVSRTPMREAIRILANEGLVVLRPSRSPIVANPGLKEIADAIDVLRALELLSGELACRHATDDEIARIRAIHERMTEVYGKIDTLELFEIDMSFHLAIAAASHNAALAETHRAFLARLWRARYLSARRQSSRERVLRQHGAIVAGLEARDPARVQHEIQAHLEALLDNIRHLFADDTPAQGAPCKADGRAAEA
jgi:DNA-binding GntR family transcriptional regulator